MTPDEVEKRFKSLAPPRPPERLRERCLSAHEGIGASGLSGLKRHEKLKGRQGRLLAALAAAGFLALTLWLGVWRISRGGATPAQESKKESPVDHEKLEARAKAEATREIARRLEEAYAAFSQKDFDRSLRLSKEILEIDPKYIVARELHEDSEESRKSEPYFSIAVKKIDQWKSLTNSEKGTIPWSGMVRFPSFDEWTKILGRLQDVAGKKQAPPGGESPAKIARLINDLASDEPGDRQEARNRLLALGPRALHELDRALYHENADVRIRAGELSREIREHMEHDPLLPFIQAAVGVVRKHWLARDFAEIESMVSESFSPMELKNFPHYVPKRVVEDPSRDLASVMAATGAGEDFLSKAVASELDKEPGMVFLEFADEAKVDKVRTGGTFASWGTLFFTLPDRKGWTAYIVLDLPSPAVFQEKNCTLRTSWNRWAAFGTTLNFATGAADEIKVTAGASGFWASTYGALLKPGDIVREVNGKLASEVAHVRALFNDPPPVSGTPGKRSDEDDVRTLVIDRDGKVFTARIQLTVP